MVSCGSGNKEQRDIVTEWIGKKLIIPDSLQFQIGEIPIDYDFNDADYKIVTYIDSAGCTGCKMRLKKWNEVINQFKQNPDIDVDFMMVVNSSEPRTIHGLIKRDNFNHLIAIDRNNDFFRINGISKIRDYQTFLLDSDNVVIGIGNPCSNPHIRSLYESIIYNQGSSKTMSGICRHPIRSVGVICNGDTLKETYRLVNNTTKSLTVQEMETSCNCVSAQINSNEISKGEYEDIIVTYIPDVNNTSSRFLRYVDVYFQESPDPVRLILYGFSKQ